MSLADFHTQLKARLAADTGLAAWASQHLRRPWTQIDGNVPVEAVRPAELPALIFELGDADVGNLTMGNRVQESTGDFLLAAVWSEQDPARAFAQRMALPPLMLQALMTDPLLGGSVAAAWVSGYQPDRGANHPTQVMRFAITGIYEEHKA